MGPNHGVMDPNRVAIVPEPMVRERTDAAADRTLVRSLICTSRSCAVHPMAGVTVDIRDRVMAAAAARLQATAVRVAVTAAADMSAPRAAAVPSVEADALVVEADTPAVVDTPAAAVMEAIANRVSYAAAS
jgi:hypothetical protein